MTTHVLSGCRSWTPLVNDFLLINQCNLRKHSEKKSGQGDNDSTQPLGPTQSLGPFKVAILSFTNATHISNTLNQNCEKRNCRQNY